MVKPLEQTFWYRFANGVMRRALPIGLVVTALLVGLGLPFLHANFGFPDDRVIPKSEAWQYIAYVGETSAGTGRERVNKEVDHTGRSVFGYDSIVNVNISANRS